jgi:transketolase
MIEALRRTIIETAHHAGEGHIPSALSILDIVWVLYDRVLTYTPRAPNNPIRDRFILSKGHGCLALYAVLAEKGFFSKAWLDRFCVPGFELDGHPDCLKVPGVEATTGSLGHGLPMAVGMALGLKIRKSNARVFCLIGDQEALEGTTWESAALAAQHRLNNLTVIIDHNHSGDDIVNMGGLGRKFEAFEWHVDDICGHNHHDIEQAARAQRWTSPNCIVAQTIKGRGVPVMERDPRAWHHRAPTAAEMPELLGEMVDA